MVTLRLTFWGNFTLFCTAVTPFSPPTNRAQEFQFLHILNNTCYVESFFINSIVMKWYLILISFFCDCAGSLSLHEGFLQFWWAVETLCCSARASHCGGCSCGGARGTRLTDSGSMQAHGYEGSALAANSLRRCGALECFQFSSVPQSCWTLWDPMDCSTPGLPVHHQLPELTQTHDHWVGDPANHLILCYPLLLPPLIFPSIRVFSSESVLRIRWPKYWSFSFSISPSSEYSGLISFMMDWLDLLAVQETYSIVK